jgi:hypothetical protein
MLMVFDSTLGCCLGGDGHRGSDDGMVKKKKMLGGWHARGAFLANSLVLFPALGPGNKLCMTSTELLREERLSHTTNESGNYRPVDYYYSVKIR